jgi:hypothetical protein
MDSHGQRLAETFLPMINIHDLGPLERFLAEGHRDPQRLRQ